MNQKEIGALINLAQKLYKQKLPLVTIGLIVGLAFFTGQYALLDGFFVVATPNKMPTVSIPSTTDMTCKVVKIYDGDTVTL
ncbi:hypothetical protein, partial [Candidatus Albibeggiatoa sp. nov. BB20]|uniref:hypothetical protein n=1 Tax=Candidatus Albibeggiatoa sp. nov. BB20 TaxID=3162723 RepID=UPI0033656239